MLLMRHGLGAVARAPPPRRSLSFRQSNALGFDYLRLVGITPAFASSGRTAPHISLLTWLADDGSTLRPSAVHTIRPPLPSACHTSTRCGTMRWVSVVASCLTFV